MPKVATTAGARWSTLPAYGVRRCLWINPGGPATYELIKNGYVCEGRGIITVKGRNEMETYLLTAKTRCVSCGQPIAI